MASDHDLKSLREHMLKVAAEIAQETADKLGEPAIGAAIAKAILAYKN